MNSISFAKTFFLFCLDDRCGEDREALDLREKAKGQPKKKGQAKVSQKQKRENKSYPQKKEGNLTQQHLTKAVVPSF